VASTACERSLKVEGLPIMIRFSSILVLLAATLGSPALGPQPTPLVRTVLFFSPSCPHCHTVITESLPPLVEKYGESLVIVAINTQSLDGQQLFREAGLRYGIPPEQLGVPLLAVGDRALIGSFDIPDQLPAIVEDGLAAGGIPWPEIDGLRAALVAAGIEEAEPPAVDERVEAAERLAVEEPPPVTEAEPEPASPVRTPEAETRGLIMDLAAAESRTAGMTPWQKFDQDRAGNSIAVLALIGMIVSVLAVLIVVVRRSTVPRWPGWIVALMILAGLAVAAYLSYVEVTQSLAICGPVGDCNTVQQSPYARVFGLIPIGLLGFYGYTVLGLGWLLRDRGPLQWNTLLATGLWFLALFGTLFSIYLTVLEPFVIGATCMWCVTSAILMTLLLWASTPAAVETWRKPAQK
jgi:uncharacterized membrane protein/thiol-disulfide isomerase/thioredoxin